MPIIYTTILERGCKRKRDRDLGEQPIAVKQLHPTVAEAVFQGILSDKAPDLVFKSVRGAAGTFPVCVKKLYVWADLANASDLDEDIMEIDVLTNSTLNPTDYVSILSRSVTVSHLTASRELINVSAHLGNNTLSADSVVVIRRKTALKDDLYIPTIITLEYQPV